eukprot:6365607-Prymnesium_polylepis.1
MEPAFRGIYVVAVPDLPWGRRGAEHLQARAEPPAMDGAACLSLSTAPRPTRAASPLSPSQTHSEVGQPDAQLVISVASPQRSGGKANCKESPADSAAEGGQAGGITNRRRRYARRACVNAASPGGVRVVAPPLSRVVPKTLPTARRVCTQMEERLWEECGGAEEDRLLGRPTLAQVDLSSCPRGRIRPGGGGGGPG